MGPIWGRQDPGGPHVGPMNFAIWAVMHYPKFQDNMATNMNIMEETICGEIWVEDEFQTIITSCNSWVMADTVQIWKPNLVIIMLVKA